MAQSGLKRGHLKKILNNLIILSHTNGFRKATRNQSGQATGEQEKSQQMG